MYREGKRHDIVKRKTQEAGCSIYVKRDMKITQNNLLCVNMYICMGKDMEG
jgi:hypothetical protein